MIEKEAGGGEGGAIRKERAVESSGGGEGSAIGAGGGAAAHAGDTLYLCKFRVSVDGDWLCLKELEDGVTDAAVDAAGMPFPSEAKRPDFPTTPEFEQIVRYPNYPVGRTGIRGQSLFLLSEA